MQLDVLSVFQLPAASGLQSGKFYLQENGALTLKEFREQQRRGFSWSSTCGLFACSRQNRYAVDLESNWALFALVKGIAKPSVWVLVADEDGRPGSVRVEPLRGHYQQPAVLRAPHELPYDQLLGMGLPPTFERGADVVDGLMGVTSSQIVVEPSLGVNWSYTHLIAHAYWRSACPGKLVLAAARWDAAEVKGPSPGALSRRTNSRVDAWQHTPSKQAMLWHWHVLLVTEGFDFIGPAAQLGNHARVAASSSPGSLPTLTDVSMSWHPQGSALALYLTDSAGRSCVAALDGSSLEVLWHKRLVVEPDGSIPPDGLIGTATTLASDGCASAMAWVPNTSLLAVLDRSGQLHLLDARGTRKGASLLCGAIKYGESTFLRLAPIMAKAVPLPLGASRVFCESIVSDRSTRRDGAGFGVSIGNSACSNGDTRVSSDRDQQACFTLAFSAATKVFKGASTDAAQTAGTVGASIMAVCDGSSVVLVRVGFSNEPATPTAEYRRGLDGAVGVDDGEIFAHAKPPGKEDDSPDGDLVPALRTDVSSIQIDGLLDNAPSFGNSAVSTPYMLGLQSVTMGGSSTGAGATQSAWRPTTSEVPMPPAWPLRWRSILTLPPASTVHGAAASIVNAHASHWGIVPMSKAGAPSSLAASSINPASKLDRGGTPGGGWGVCPSPAGSTANLLDPSLNLAANSVGWDAALPSGGDMTDTGVNVGREAYQDALTSVVPAATGLAAMPGVVLCTATGPLHALHQGDLLVLRGSIAESLEHYPRAHVYGFLPAFLALVHLHRIDEAACLLRAYANFTGRVALACAGGRSTCSCREGRGAAAVASEAAAAVPLGSGAIATDLAKEWQSTMARILDGAVIDHLGTNIGSGIGGFGSASGGAGTNRQGRNTEDMFPKWQNSLQRVQEDPACLEPDVNRPDTARLALQEAGKAATTAAPGPYTFGAERPQGREAAPDSQGMVSIPVAEALDEQAQVGAAFVSSNVQDRCGAAAAAAATSLGGGLSDDHPEEHVLLPVDGDMGIGLPLQSPSAALKDMLRVCLQLLLLACHAMAFIAFSAHSAGRAVAAVAAADLLALPMSPASPRSPGGSVLSRQAIRRLSSTVRMRSLKTRSVNMFGSSAFCAALGTFPSAQGTPAASIPAIATPIMRVDSATSYRGGCASSAPMVGGMNASLQAPNAAAMVIGFPIPVVWQPQSQGQKPPLSSTRGGGTLSLAQLTGGRSTLQHPASGTSPHVSRAGTFGGPITEPSVSFAASGSAAASHSPPSSPPSIPHHQHQTSLPPGAMRLRLHHCAFDVTRLWQDASAQRLPLGQSAATVYLKPSYAAGLLLMAHACSMQLEELQQQDSNHHNRHPKLQRRRDDRHEQLHHASSEGEQQQQAHQNHYSSKAQRQGSRLPGHAHPHAQCGTLRGGGTRPPRVNWQLLRASASATHAAAVWQQLNDWRRAALLVFACANTFTQQGGGSEDLVLSPPSNGRQRRASVRSADGATADLPHTDRQLATGADAAAAAADPAAGPLSEREGPGSGGCCSILATSRASCLRMGQEVLFSQVVACQKMEVQDACGVMMELVALPRRLLGLQSAVHISLLQKVCTRVLDLLPARVNITPLLPAGAVPPLLQLSHSGIRAQLVAHCGAAVARVLEELRLAAACGGGIVSLRDAVQQVVDHATVDSCVRMLLRWQGSYDGSRVDAAAVRLAESVQDATLLPDTTDWSPDAVLPSLQDAFVTSGLLSVPDAAAVVKAAYASAAASIDSGSQLIVGLVEEQQEKGSGAGTAPADPSQGLQDLDELALLLDLTQLQHTLLASLQPFLHDALLLLRGCADKNAAAGTATGKERLRAGSSITASSASAASLPGAFGEEDHEEELADSATLAALPPVELAMSCLKLLLKVQWAMHCRAQVCALMLRLVKLQAQPPQLSSAVSAVTLAPTSPTRLAPAPTSPPIVTATATAVAGGGPDTFREVSQPLMHPMPSLSSGQIHISPRSFSHSSIGHRSFRDYIHHMASGTPPLGQTPQLDITQQQQQQQPDLLPAQQPQQKSQAMYQRRDNGIRVAAGSSSSATGAGSLHLQSQMDSATELDHVQGSLMAWTAALVHADVFHSSNELQGCVLTVLSVVKSCPLVLITALNRALERREILNKALAEQVRRLKGSARPPTAAAQLATGALASSLPAPAATAAGEPAAAAAGPIAAAAKADGRGTRSSVFAMAAGSGASFRVEGPARVGSLLVPGGALAPAPSLVMDSGACVQTSDAEGAAWQLATNSVEDLGSSPRAGRAGSVALPGLPLGRIGSLVQRGLIAADGGLSVVAEGLDGGDGDGDGDNDTGSSPQTSSPADASAPPNEMLLTIQSTTANADQQAVVTDTQPPPTRIAPSAWPAALAPANAQSTHPLESHLPRQGTAAVPAQLSETERSQRSQMHSMQLAVAMAHADIQNTCLKLLEYYADPSGAIPSGLSTPAAAGSGQGGGALLGKGSGGKIRGAAWTSTGVRTPQSPTTNATVGGNGGGRNETWRPWVLSRSQTFSRVSLHSTLLQCLVCELVRTSHSVTASLSWKATLEGGRGLAGCFVHPILHGSSSNSSSAAVASVVAAAAAAAAAAQEAVPSSVIGGKRRNKAVAAKGSAAAVVASAPEEVEDLGSVPVFLPGAEGAQALLLSLLDIQQWGAELKQLPVPSVRNGCYMVASVASGLARSGPARVKAQTTITGAAASAKEGEEVEEPDGGVVEDTEVDPRVADEEGRSYYDGPRASSLGSGHGNTSRLSFSGLTDGDNDSGGYPTPASAVAIPSNAKTSGGRPVNPIIRHHTNPAFGLHSPTPSNLSEFSEETSDLASPHSTMVTPPPPEGGRPDAAALDPRRLWRADSSPTLTDAAPLPQGTRSPSPELSPGGGGRVKTTAGDSAGISVAGTAPPAVVGRTSLAVNSSSDLSVKVPDDRSPRQGLRVSSASLNGGSGVSNRCDSSGGVQAAVGGAAVDVATVAYATAASEAMPDRQHDDAAGEPEQLPTLSYLLNVQTLADIRRAVKEAHADGSDDPTKASYGGGGTTEMTDPSALGASSAKARANDNDHSHTGTVGAPAGDVSLSWVEELSSSFGAVHPAASNTPSISEISVRGGISAKFLATGMMPGSEVREGDAVELKVSKGGAESHVKPADVSATGTTAATMATAAASGSNERAPKFGASVAQASLPNIGKGKESELTFESTSSRRSLFSTEVAKDDGGSASSAVLLLPRTSVAIPNAGGSGSLLPRGPSLSQDGRADVVHLTALMTVPQSSPHSPLLRRSQADAVTTAAARESRGSGTGFGRNTPSSPLCLNDLYHAGLGVGQSSVYQQQPASPSACSVASSISLSSPCLAKTGSPGPGGAQQLQSYTLSRDGSLPTSGKSRQPEAPMHDVVSHRHGAMDSRQPQPRPVAHQRSPQARNTAARGIGSLQRSASASAAASTMESPAITRQLPPMVAPLWGTVSQGSAASTETTPSGDQIQIQDFLREPSTSSSLSARAIGSEFFHTPASAGDSVSRSTATSITSTGVGVGQEGTSLSPSVSTAASVPAGATTLGLLPLPLPAQHLQQEWPGSPDRPPHRYHASLAASSTARIGVGHKRPSTDADPSIVARASTLSHTAGSAASKQLQRGSREETTWGHEASRHRRPSFEADQAAKGLPRAGGGSGASPGVIGGGASPAVSGGGAALNPLFSARAAAAVFAGGPSSQQQALRSHSSTRADGGGDTPRGGPGGAVGRGSKLQSAKGGSFGRSSSRPMWH